MGRVGPGTGFFRESRGFLGTELLRDERNPQRVLTIDRWVSASAYEECRWARGDAYDALDLPAPRSQTANPVSAPSH
jgi:hypothetical protein